MQLQRLVVRQELSDRLQQLGLSHLGRVAALTREYRCDLS